MTFYLKNITEFYSICCSKNCSLGKVSLSTCENRKEKSWREISLKTQISIPQVHSIVLLKLTLFSLPSHLISTYECYRINWSGKWMSQKMTLKGFFCCKKSQLQQPPHSCAVHSHFLPLSLALSPNISEKRHMWNKSSAFELRK